MSAPFDHDALWLKAKLFLGRAMDTDVPRSFDERALWASLALEVLAKAALARHSPLLIAIPSEEGISLLVASGLVQGNAVFRSISGRTLYSRCQKAFKPFSFNEAQLIAGNRNEYLHGSGVGFTDLPETTWWPRYWAQASILVSALDMGIDDLVGWTREDIVQRYLAQNKKNIEDRLEMKIERARQRLEQQRSGSLPARIAEEWARAADLTIGGRHRFEEVCPACGEIGVLEGDEVLTADTRSERMSKDDYDVWMELSIASDHFSCKTCRLTLDYELLAPAGLPSQFIAIGDYTDYMEEDYGND